VRLLLEDVSLKVLLKVSDLNEETQLPKRHCVYYRFLYDIFDAFFVDEWMSWRREVRDGQGIEFSIIIQEGRPLIINYVNFH
jgi:hypothetical protein